ncbi:VanZ family protein [Lachnospiraceae bacterium 46-15]
MIRSLLKPLSFLPALLLMYMIFSFSAQPGEVSSQMSYKASCKIIEAADYIFDANLEEWQIAEWADKIHFITRKLAHMAEYFALAVAVAFPLYVYGLHGFLLMLTAGFICVAFACGDEYHQSLVAGRSPSAKDVCIDSVGIFFGILLVRIIGWTGRKTIFRPKRNRKMRGKKQRFKDTTGYDGEYSDVPYPRQPYSREGYPAPPYREPEGYRQPPYPPQGSYHEPPYAPQGSYREPPYPPQGSYYEPPRQQQSSYPPPSRGTQDDYWQRPERSYQEPEEEWLDEEAIDIDSPRDETYSPDWQDPARANDWGIDEQPPRPSQPPQAVPPKRRRRAKREKDWFFDM